MIGIDRLLCRDSINFGKIVKSTMRGIQRSDFIKEKILKHANNNLSFF